MDLEDSISSWIGKIREGFDTFCSEAKDKLPQHVQNVQEKLIRAAENLKQLRCDLDIFSTCTLDYSENGMGPKSDETEENMDSHTENKSSDHKKDVTEGAEVEEKIPERVGFAIAMKSVVEKDKAKSAEMEEEIDLGCDNGSNARLCPIPVELEPGTFRSYPLHAGEPNKIEDFSKNTFLLNLEELEFHHPPLMESFKFSDDDIHEGILSTTEELSDFKPETQSSHYFDLLGEELRGGVIRDGFLSPLSDSTFDYETRSGLLDAMTFLDNFLDSDSASIPDMPEGWSNFTQSPVSNIAESNAEIMLEKDWERLDAYFIDEDWEIVSK